MRVAIVHNRDSTGVINRFGRPTPKEYISIRTSEHIMAALRDGGHETLLCEGDKGLLTTLERFMPPNSQSSPSGIVFNCTTGIQGEFRFTHVPAMLEMAGVPYTGSGPLGQGLMQDKVVTKMLIRGCGVPTPNFRLMRRGTESMDDLRFPVIVKPRIEECSLGLQLVYGPAQLKPAVETIVMQYGQDALVEEYIDGRELAIPLLGNEQLEVLPFVEVDFGDRETRLFSWEEKSRAVAMSPPICPAQIGDGLREVLADVSVATFRTCQCRDFARVDIRIDGSGKPFVLEINAMPSLAPTGFFALAAKMNRESYSSLINRMLDIAHARYFAGA